jgi:hypothetical protein
MKHIKKTPVDILNIRLAINDLCDSDLSSKQIKEGINTLNNECNKIINSLELCHDPYQAQKIKVETCQNKPFKAN